MDLKKALIGTIGGTLLGVGIGGVKGLEKGLGVGMVIGLGTGMTLGVLSSMAFVFGKKKIKSKCS